MQFYLQHPAIDPQAAHIARSYGELAAFPGRAVTPLGSVEWTRAYAAVFGVSLQNPQTYPDDLRRFLLRDVRQATFADALPHEFVKPLICKQFIAGIRGEMYSEMIDDWSPAYISEPVKWIAEWRMYVCQGKIVGGAQYSDGDDAEPPVAWAQTLADHWREQPAGWSLDVGMLDDGRLALVEVNDGWALGFYKGCPPQAYLAVISARWAEIVAGRAI